MWSKFSKKSILIVYFAEILGIIGIGFSYLALQRAPVSLVALLEGFEAPFVLVIALFISRFFPKILKEEIKTKTITIKIISIILMVGGLYLIAT